MSGWKLTEALQKKIYNYARFPATGVSMQQMVQFGSRSSAGTLFRASQFVAEELPIRLAHRVKDLESLPHGLSNMPSIMRVRDWYAQSFEELTELPIPKLDADIKQKLFRPVNVPPPYQQLQNGEHGHHDHRHRNPSGIYAKDLALKPEAAQGPFMPDSVENPSLGSWHYSTPGLTKRLINNRRYYASVEPDVIWPPEIYGYNSLLTEALKKIKKRHDPVVTTVAKGVLEWKESSYSNGKGPIEESPNIEELIDTGANISSESNQLVQNNHNSNSQTASSGTNISIRNREVQAFLDRFYMSRIGIRMLIGQHIALNEEPIREDYVGIICTKVPIREMAQVAADNARFICEEWYGLYEAPRVDIVCPPDLSFMYVPGHLNHMLFETIKNSLRAVVETHGVNTDPDNFPPVKIIVARGNEDITIKISDEGGGIPRSEIPHIWTYMYTTVPSTPLLDLDFNNSDFKAPMAGFGYGLPISRAYARYFGGDLKIISMEGYGTDAYLHLNRLSSSSEPLQ